MQETSKKETPTPQLLLATIKLLRKSLVFHRDWSGNILAKATFDSAPVKIEKHEAAKVIQCWWRLRKNIPLESMLSGAEVFLLSKEVAPAPSPKSKGSKKKGFSAIVFGQSAVKLICSTPYTCFLERCSKDELIAFMKRTFREPTTDMMNFASAWTEKGDFFASGGKNLRLDFSALVEERFSNVSGSGSMDSCGSNIFRIVRFCHLDRDTLPFSENIFKNRFCKAICGLKRKDRDKWFLLFMEDFRNNVYGSNCFFSKKIKKERLELNKKLQSVQKSMESVSLEIDEKSTHNDAAANELVGREKISYLDKKPLFIKWNRLEEEKEALLEKLKIVTKNIKERNKTMMSNIIRFYRSGKLLRTIPSDDVFQNKLDKRAMREYLSFLCTCPEYWKVARDFPSAIMKYVLKDCQRNGKCTVCKAMCAFHTENIRLKSMDLMLAPHSPFLRRSGQEVFLKNIELCVSKWKQFARFPYKFKNLVPSLLFQRMEMYKELVQLKSRRASTVYELPACDRERLSKLEVSTNSIFNGGILSSFFDEKRERHLVLKETLQNLLDDLKLQKAAQTKIDKIETCKDEIKKVSTELQKLFSIPSLLTFVQEVLGYHTFVSPNSNKIMFVHDFIYQLRLCIALRSVTVFKGLIPSGCSILKFPNSALKASSEPAGYASESSNPTGPVCFAFARRWRVKDLVNRITRCMEKGQLVCLHVEGDAPFMFHPRDNLQDWFKEVEWKNDPPYRCIKASDEAYPVSFEGVKETKPFIVSKVSQLKELMDRAVQGECYLLCSLEKKRKTLLELSREFRGGMLRRVLTRNYPQAGNSSYALLKLRADCLTKRDLDNELTISTASKVNIFGPRKTVYCIGDMWTETSLATAKHLATDNLFTIELKGDMLTSKHKFWNFNRKPVRYKDPPPAVPFSNCSFQDILSLVDKVVRNEEVMKEQTKAQDDRAKRINHLKQKSIELQLYREAKQKNGGLEQWREDTKKRSIEEAGSSGTGPVRVLKSVRYI